MGTTPVSGFILGADEGAESLVGSSMTGSKELSTVFMSTSRREGSGIGMPAMAGIVPKDTGALPAETAGIVLPPRIVDESMPEYAVLVSGVLIDALSSPRRVRTILGSGVVAGTNEKPPSVSPKVERLLEDGMEGILTLLGIGTGVALL